MRAVNILLLTALSWSASAVQAAEVRGLLDLRLVHASAARSFLDAGLGKNRYDSTSPVAALGQAVLRIDADPLDTLYAQAELSADDRQRGVADLREAWLAWRPLPEGPWKTQVRAGEFFLPSSVEIGYDAVGWTPRYTISSAAINSWIGEELRTRGVEWSMRRSARQAGSGIDAGLVAGLFGGNDPAGTLMAWRGWSVSDRIAGHREALLLPDLPVYRPDGPIPRQSRTLRPFREVDGRLGYYIGAQAGMGRQLEVAALRYDNRANALAVEDGQYAWRTRFNHVSLVWRPNTQWEVLAQAMRGDTLMGANAVALDFRSWYALLARQFGTASLALRYERFSTSEHDLLPGDPNQEHGQGLALACRQPLTDQAELVLEWLTVRSDRPARRQLGLAPGQRERTLSAAVRWTF